MLGGIINGVQLLLARFTSARAGYLDKLNISGNVVGDANYTSARATKLDNMDASVSSRGAEATLTDIKGSGWSPTTDTLKKIRDAIADKGQKLLTANGTVAGTTETTVLNYTGVGKLHSMWFSCDTGSENNVQNVKVNIDGQGEIDIKANSIAHWMLHDDGGDSSRWMIPLGGIRFKTSCVIKLKGDSPVTSYRYNILYSTDI